MELHTLILTPWYQPHRIVPWRDSIGKLVDGTIMVLAEYDEVVSSPSVSFKVPSVAVLTTKVPNRKKGVKFSRVNVLTRDNFTCQYCGIQLPRRQLNYDHVIPRCLGGKTTWGNVVSACYSCNGRKGGRTPEQAGMRLIKRPVRPDHLPLAELSIQVNTIPEDWKPFLGLSEACSRHG